MKKRIICLILIALLLTMLAPSSAMATIDFTRIKLSSGSEPLIFKFGSVKISGNLEQVVPFTYDAIQNLIDDVLSRMGKTRADIELAQEQCEKAKRATQFTAEDMERIKKNIYTSIDTATIMDIEGKIDAALKIIKVLETVLSVVDPSELGKNSADLGTDALNDWVKNTASKTIDAKAPELGETVIGTLDRLKKIYDFISMLVDEHQRTQQKWKDIADGANAKRLLDEFYYNLSDRVESLKKQSDDKGWQINFDNAMAGRTFTFYGVPGFYQTWTLDMRLKQTYKDDLGSAVGNYTGEYIIRAEHEMSEFSSKATEVLKTMIKLDEFFKKAEAMGSKVIRYETVSEGNLYISRTISGNCSAVINKDGTIDFNIFNEDDEKMIDLSGLAVDLDIRDINTSGIRSVTTYKFELSGTKDKLFIKVNSVDVNIKTPDQKVSASLGSAQGEVPMDQEIWKPWDGTKKEIVHDN